MSYLENQLSLSVGVPVIQQQSIQNICVSWLEKQQEELVSGWAGMKQVEEDLQDPTKLAREGGRKTEIK